MRSYLNTVQRNHEASFLTCRFTFALIFCLVQSCMLCRQKSRLGYIYGMARLSGHFYALLETGRVGG